MNYSSWKRSHDSVGCATIIGIILLVAALIFLGPVITMWLWNWIAVDLFTLPVIGYWEAWGLTWLCHILFGHTVTVKKD
jgi:hypothetical protein